MKILNLLKKRKKYDFDVDESNLHIDEKINQYHKLRHQFMSDSMSLKTTGKSSS